METVCHSLVKLHKFVLNILKSVFSNVYLYDSMLLHGPLTPSL